MSETKQAESGAPEPGAEAVEAGSYEVLRRRLADLGQELATRAEALNARRKQVFGGDELQVIGNERIRTEHNCVPVEILAVGDLLWIGYDVYIGLKSEITVGDVFGLYRFGQGESGSFEFAPVPLDAAGGFLQAPDFLRDLKELFQYYKQARLVQLSRTDAKLLALFLTGASASDVKVFRWELRGGVPRYLDNRGERDHLLPPAHDFEWKPTGREDHVAGKHPHVSIQDQVFVETVGGDLTIKVENNTEDGLGIFREPVDDADQALDDAQIHYARIGDLYLLKVLPFREDRWRYFICNRRTATAWRVDAIGQACVSLPEDHGVIFPGGYVLQSGEHKLFEGDAGGLEYQRAIRSPNGEDVLYVFLRKSDGHYVLFPYNVIRKEIQSPIHCHGYCLFADGKMIVFRVTTAEASRVHPMQIWQTPFVSAEHAASAPRDGSYLAKVGNPDLVRGISEALSVRRLTESQRPNRRTYDEIVRSVTRMIDAFYWLGHEEAGDLLSTLKGIQKNAELCVDEFEKVVAIQRRAEDALREARRTQEELLRKVRPADLRSVDAFMAALAALRAQRGKLITLRELRYMDLEAVDALEAETASHADKTSAACAEFLLTDAALAPLTGKIAELLRRIEAAGKATELSPLATELEALVEGMNALAEIAGGLQVEDATARARILETISEVFGQLNRVRATLTVRRKDVLGREGRAEFAAQFKLLGQNAESAIARADSPERCDEELSRVLLQIEEVEGRFSEFEEFVADLARKREEVYEALSAKKQTLVEERQRRARTLTTAGERILEGAGRRARGFASADELNAYLASDPMLLKLREIVGRLRELGDSVKADELESRLKSARQDALRILRDRSELFEEGASIIKLGRHKFSVNTQPLELTMVPHEGAMAFHLSGTDYYGPVEDETFAATRELWEQTLVSETPRVYRGEYLAASLLLDAQRAAGGLDLERLRAAQADGSLAVLVRDRAGERYDEGYERGVHDVDATAILDRLLAMIATAGLLRFPPAPRGLALLYWTFGVDSLKREGWLLRARSLGRLRSSLRAGAALAPLAQELAAELGRFAERAKIAAAEAELRLAGEYLAEELSLPSGPSFTVSTGSVALRDALVAALEREGTRRALEEDLQVLLDGDDLPEAIALASAWVDAFLARSAPDPAVAEHAHARRMVAALLLVGERVSLRPSAAIAAVSLPGLLGQHPRIQGGVLTLRLDEFLERLGDHVHHTVPRFRDYRKLRQGLVERERERLRLEEFKPRVLTSFVRNRLVSEVYLPLVGDNLAKQLGAVGEGKRTDLQGLLLLVSPPGYGKTTLMEYLASQLGLVFMKVNGPALGHGVTSLDPSEAASATARQEVEKINLAFEMGNNVMLYLDDIQHTNPELLQKFISLCDAQRRVEGVWRGKTRTYDMRGKKFCMVMAGNPYTESGERFRIPDMLANRADTYNLGDILEGKGDLFALSYLENALTSNLTLAPLAGRRPEDVQLLIRMARGEDVAQGELSYPYSAAEIADLTAVLRHLSQVQRLLLRVNQEYIASAAQEDAYRAEPRFQLQGSYRNMNKLAAKIVPALNEEELERVIDDHYQGEAQTLTTGAEQNLLKLHELRGRLRPDQAARWAEIKASFQRRQRMGGSEDDPAVRVIGQLSDIGERLDGIRTGLAAAATAAQQRDAETGTRDSTSQTQLARVLAKLDEAIAKLARPELDVNVQTNLPPGFSDLLDNQIALVEKILNPLMTTVTRSLEQGDSMRVSLMALVDDLKRMEQQLKQASPEELARTRDSGTP